MVEVGTRHCHRTLLEISNYDVCQELCARFVIHCVLYTKPFNFSSIPTGIGIPFINLRRSDDRLRFIMGITLPIRRCVSELRPGVTSLASRQSRKPQYQWNSPTEREQIYSMDSLRYHDDVIKWKHFSRYWPIVKGIHRSPLNSPHKAQWRGALMFSLICASINGWVHNHEAGDLRRHCAHYDVTV